MFPRANRYGGIRSEAPRQRTGSARCVPKTNKERVMGFEPTTTTLATSCSTN